MKDSITIYAQPGTHGIHAGARYPSEAWAAHPNDEETAVWRCALRHWFPKRLNGVLLFRESQAITLQEIGEHQYQATLDVPDAQVQLFEWRKGFTPELPLDAPKNGKSKRPAARRKGKKK